MILDLRVIEVTSDLLVYTRRPTKDGEDEHPTVPFGPPPENYYNQDLPAGMFRPSNNGGNLNFI